MKPLVISKYEYQVLALFAIGIILNIFLIKLPFDYISFLFIFGITFEILSENNWNYNQILLKSTFTLRDRDVNLIFGLGWIGNLTIGLTGALLIHKITGWPMLVCCALGNGTLGVIMEKVYLVLGLWKYNWESKGITLGFKHMPSIAGLPLSVIIGYYLFTGPMVFFMVYKVCPFLFGSN